MSFARYCSRSFLAEKLIIHNRSCTEDKPSRKPTDPVNRRSQKLDSLGSPDLPRAEQPKRPKSSSSLRSSTSKLGQSSGANGVASGYSTGDFSAKYNSTMNSTVKSMNSTSNHKTVHFGEGDSDPLEDSLAETVVTNSVKKGVYDVNSADSVGSPTEVAGTQDDVQHMKIVNGSLVGHLGGSSGRSLRKSSSPVPSVGDSTDQSSRQQTITAIAQRLDQAERMTLSLSNAISEMREALNSLK